MSKISETLRNHVYCVLIVAALILLGVIAFWVGGKGSEVVSYLSFASAVTSIVLAVIVIVYMYYQDYRSSQNITEMRSLIDQASRTMTDKASLIVDKAQSIDQALIGLTQPPADRELAMPPLEIQEPLKLDISAYSNIGLLTLYSLVKSYESRKPISIFEIFQPAVDNYSEMSFFSLGIINSLEAFWGKDFLTVSAKQQELKKLPDGFKESVTAQIDKRLKKSKDKGRDEDYAELKDAWDSIDNYFDNL